MADQYVNGLLLTAPVASQCGRTFSRWLVEWLTQLCGWTVVQAVTGNWQNYVSQGTSGSIPTSSGTNSNVFKSNAYTFSSTDLGSYLTITGFTGRWVGRNGIYRIHRLVSGDSQSVVLDTKFGIHEDGFPPATSGLTWKLWRPTIAYVPTNGDVIVLAGQGTIGSGYPFHLHINVRNTNSYFPELRMSPFASWVSGSGWSDLRYTSAVGIDNQTSSLLNTDNVRIWAVGDQDRFAIGMRVEDDQYSWHFIYGGEIDPKDISVDTHPCVLWSGSTNGNSSIGYDATTFFGYGYAGTIATGGKWLGFDNLTTVTGNMMIAHMQPNADANWIAETYDWWNERSRARYKQPILCECRTSGYMEVRGALRRVWASCRAIPRMHVLGVNGEYIHLKGGLIFPWNNSKSYYERG